MQAELKLDKEEVKMLERAAAIMASLLLDLKKVLTVNVYDVPHYVDEGERHPFMYRLLAVVSQATFDEYQERLQNPPTIGGSDSDDNGNGCVFEYTEMAEEAPFHVLGTTPETFFGRVDAEIMADDLACGLDAQSTINVVLVPDNWTKRGALLGRGYTGLDGKFHAPIFGDRECNYALASYMVFDPATNTFVSPR